MAGAARGAGVGGHDEPGDSQARLDLQKKTLGTSERDEQARSAWKERISRGSIRENSSSWTSVPRTSGAYAAAGEGAQRREGLRQGAKEPWEEHHAAGEHGRGGMGPAVAVEGSTTTAMFEAYVEHFLAPALKEGQIVVLDNLNAHKGERVRRLVEARGAPGVSAFLLA